MEIKWSKVVALGLALLAIVLAVRYHRELHSTIAVIGHIGPGHSIEEQTIGLAVLGLILVSLVAIVRLFTNGNGRKDQ